MSDDICRIHRELRMASELSTLVKWVLIMAFFATVPPIFLLFGTWILNPRNGSWLVWI